MNRTPIYAALIAALGALKDNGTVKAVRRPTTGQDFVMPPVLPCCLIIGDKESVRQRRGLPPQHELMIDVHLHANVGKAEAPADRLDAMLGAIEAVLAPAPGQDTQTLGGAVHHCWIEGDIERFELLPDQRCLAIVPVHILVP